MYISFQNASHYCYSHHHIEKDYFGELFAIRNQWNRHGNPINATICFRVTNHCKEMIWPFSSSYKRKLGRMGKMKHNKKDVYKLTILIRSKATHTRQNYKPISVS